MLVSYSDPEEKLQALPMAIWPQLEGQCAQFPLDGKVSLASEVDP